MKTMFTHTRSEAGTQAAAGPDESREGNRLLDSDCGKNDLRNDRGSAQAAKIILVPLTLSGNSHQTLAIARNLARNSEAKVVLLHVVQLNIAGEERGIQRTRLLNELCRNAEYQLRELANTLGSQISTEVLVCEGRPAEAIVETAKRLAADTIVIWTRGYRRWLKWLHRNTAFNVMRQAPCGIILVSPRKHDATLSLMMAGQSTINPHSERMAVPEDKSPSRSLFRVLFS